MTQENLDRINDYVTANQSRLKNICFKLYRGHYLWEDLFQEFYLKVIETTDDKVNRYGLAQLCYFQILETYRHRNRKSSALRTVAYQEIRAIDVPVTYEYTLDIEEYIDHELNKEHGFAEIMVFMEAQEKTLRELNKETGISLFSLCRYRQAGQKKLQNLLQCPI